MSSMDGAASTVADDCVVSVRVVAAVAVNGAAAETVAA